jgi:putative transposase
MSYAPFMARQSRIVLPDTPHHVTQRGNRGENIFFEKSDYESYIAFLAEECADKGVAIWAYCLLPTQIQLIAVPRREHSLARALGEAHRRYTRRINERNGWRGHLFQDRFFSYPMDEQHLLKAAQYIETMPVYAKLAPSPESYLWSSARAHVKGRDDKLLSADKPLLHFTVDWNEFLKQMPDAPESKSIERHLQTGRPCGNDNFLDAVESMVGRIVRPQKPGRRSITFTKNLYK